MANNKWQDVLKIDKYYFYDFTYISTSSVNVSDVSCAACLYSWSGWANRKNSHYRENKGNIVC